jgi:DNA-binding response OmpR family regulator
VILKRGKSFQSETQVVEFGSSSLDLNNLILISNNEQHQLTQKEADILAFLASEPNALLKREQILLAVWQEDGYFIGRSLDVFISKLRKYLKPDNGIKIVNVHGKGYRFEISL